MTVSTPLQLFGALVDSAAWPALRIILHLAFFAAAVIILWRIWTRLAGAKARPGQTLQLFGTLPMALVAAAFLGVLIYQASWHLTGLFRPEFVGFMQSHDRREFNPAHRIQRGRILDRRGQVLAESQERDGRVYRVYPYGPAFAHTVGYSDPRFGAIGAEAAANAQLNGATPEVLASWGELGRQLLTKDKRPRGQDLQLTLDAELQLLALQRLGNRNGAVVLMRPADGALLVLANNPAFDPNRLSPALFSGPAAGTPLLNRATQGLYPPGSVFKVVLAAAAIESGFSGTLNCPASGYTTSSRYPPIRDHDYYTEAKAGRTWAGHGNLNLTTALVESSNVFFAQLGVRLGHDSFAGAGERFQFDRQVRLYPGTDRYGNLSTGRLPRFARNDLYGLAQAAIGQGRVLATPGHLATIAAAVANRGLAMRPRLLAQEPPAPLGQYMAEQTATRLAQMLRKVVTTGTGRGIDGPQLAIAGKTGTAQNPRGAAHSWFIGFAPAAAPTLAVAVLVEHGGYGSTAAAPIARDLLLKAMELENAR
ncbi:penicillin-binding protein 2 [uncultured Lamprocystis sp.]|uniref:peptidoglycan D,D-transpeptidase FtsI family protein n=2 Tax=uncultured Lamprocystis sp. TaxID=543132 RepID=UPI0026010249|nr:penicillin-binding transpeptidase domain-containing protein [uncultured Lamprocystis sp.]